MLMVVYLAAGTSPVLNQLAGMHVHFVYVCVDCMVILYVTFKMCSSFTINFYFLMPYFLSSRRRRKKNSQNGDTLSNFLHQQKQNIEKRKINSQIQICRQETPSWGRVCMYFALSYTRCYELYGLICSVAMIISI